MFSSAVVKLASGDSSWHDLTALQHHYQTQCLPTWIAWYAHQLPLWFQRFSAGTMFVVEGLVPFLIVAPRRIRFAAGAAMVPGTASGRGRRAVELLSRPADVVVVVGEATHAFRSFRSAVGHR